jgi:hypothetical protein
LREYKARGVLRVRRDWRERIDGSQQLVPVYWIEEAVGSKQGLS